PGARQPPSGHPGDAGARGDLRRARLQRGRGAGGRGRRPQLRRAQLPSRSPGARHAGHLLRAGRPALAHPHLAGADPDDALAQAADPGPLPGPGLSPRQRPAPLADVPPGRVPGRRRGDHLRRLEGDPPRLRQAALLARHRRAPAAELLPVHRAFGRGRHHLPVLPREGVRDLLAERLDGDPGRRHGRSARARAVRHRPGRLHRVRLRAGPRSGRDDPLRHPEHPRPVRGRRAPPAPGEPLMLFSRDWLARYVDLPESAVEIARRLTGAGLAVERTEERGGDVLFDVEVTTNRPDAMCHFGIARELSVLLDRPLLWPAASMREAESPAGAAIAVTIADPDLCSRYVARVVRGVRIGESPEWLRRALLSIGLRSINNVVDVTNFVLWESGQPLHAFDLARLAGGALIVRRAASGERLTTLDGV